MKISVKQAKLLSHIENEHEVKRYLYYSAQHHILHLRAYFPDTETVCMYTVMSCPYSNWFKFSIGSFVIERTSCIKKCFLILITSECIVTYIILATSKYGVNRVQLPLRLKQSLINGFSWYGLSWATVVSEHL